jgi:hypothetical protein
MSERLERFEANRRRLFGVAYRLLGEASEAEDVVQDAYLRWARTGTPVSPEAWLTKVVTNLCLDRLTSARVRRERYVGPWLPEPVVADGSVLDPVETVQQREMLSLGMLVLLERMLAEDVVAWAPTSPLCTTTSAGATSWKALFPRPVRRSCPKATTSRWATHRTRSPAGSGSGMPARPAEGSPRTRSMRWRGRPRRTRRRSACTRWRRWPAGPGRCLPGWRTPDRPCCP